MPKSYKIPFFTCLLKHGDKFLFIRRLPTQEWFPGKLSNIGGKINQHESLIDGVRREIEEETGLDADGLYLFAIGSNVYEHTGEDFFAFRFAAECGNEKLPKVSYEGELIWLTKEEVLAHTDIIPELKRCLEKYWEDDGKFFFYRAIYDTEENMKIFECQR